MYLKAASTFLAAASLVVSAAAAARADNIEFEMTGIGELNHSIHGRGIQMIFTPNALPEGGLYGEKIEQAIPVLCERYAPQAILAAKSEQNFHNPEYISVQVRWGLSFVGAYIAGFFSIEDGGCGEMIRLKQ